MSEKVIGEIVFELDPGNPPRMSEEQMARLRARKDEEIDYSDTPSQAGKPGRHIFGPRYRVGDVIALEPDVAEFFRSTGSVQFRR